MDMLPDIVRADVGPEAPMPRRVELRLPKGSCKAVLILPAGYPGERHPQLVSLLLKGQRGPGSPQEKLRFSARTQLQSLTSECLKDFIEWLQAQIAQELAWLWTSSGSE